MTGIGEGIDMCTNGTEESPEIDPRVYSQLLF